VDPEVAGVTPAAYIVAGLALGIAAGVVLAAILRARATAPASVARVEARLEVQASELRRLADAAGGRDGARDQLRAEVAGARRALEEMNVRDQERRRRQDEDSEVVRRLATVLAGGASVGRAGENLLRAHLAEFPPSMLATDVRVNGRIVEFALRLPDGRRLPIDSKWPAMGELEALESARDGPQREACVRALDRVVAARAREVAQYLDPSTTAPVAVAAVPDAAYRAMRRAHVDAFSKGVVVVPYSAALPVSLFLYALVQRFGDAEGVRSCLAEMASLLDAMEGALEGKLSRGATMIANAADDLRSDLGRARASLSRARGRSERSGATAGADDHPVAPRADDAVEPIPSADDAVERVVRGDRAG
jgi:DNA recombination protein RmuC